MAGFFHSFERAAEQNSDRCAIEVQRVDSVDRIDYARLHAMAVSAAAFLARQGARPGERWAILAENSAEWCAAYLGMSRLGLVAVPLDTNYEASQIAKLVADCGASGLVVSENSYEVAEQALRDVSNVSLFLLDADRNVRE